MRNEARRACPTAAAICASSGDIAKWLGYGLVAVLSACASAPTHYHSLAQLQQEADTATTQCTADANAADVGFKTDSIVLTHLRVPSQAYRMQLTLHQSPTRLIVYERERWASPLSEQISAVLIGNLHALLPGLTITDDPMLAGKGPPAKLQIDFEEFDARLGQEAFFRARWQLEGVAGVCSSRQTLRSGDVDELVLAWSRGLSEMTASLAHLTIWKSVPP
jgi:uncharacterized lipoprotein YmbA